MRGVGGGLLFVRGRGRAVFERGRGVGGVWVVAVVAAVECST